MPRLLPALLLTALLATAVRAQTDTLRTVQVRAEATVEVPPDLAVVSFTVTTEGRDAGEALRDNESRAARVLGAIRALGVPDRDIRVVVVPVPTGDNRARATRRVQIETETVRLAPDIAFAAAEAGSSDVPSVSFELRTATREEAEVTALAAAAALARRKAGALAQALGLSLGPARTVSDRVASDRPASEMALYQGLSRSRSDAQAAAYSVGDVTVRADVTARFDLTVPRVDG